MCVLANNYLLQQTCSKPSTVVIMNASLFPFIFDFFDLHRLLREMSVIIITTTWQNECCLVNTAFILSCGGACSAYRRVLRGQCYKGVKRMLHAPSGVYLPSCICICLSPVSLFLPPGDWWAYCIQLCQLCWSERLKGMCEWAGL